MPGRNAPAYAEESRPVYGSPGPGLGGSFEDRLLLAWHHRAPDNPDGTRDIQRGDRGAAHNVVEPGGSYQNEEPRHRYRRAEPSQSLAVADKSEDGNHYP